MSSFDPHASSSEGGGRPVQVAYASNPFEAQMIVGLLESDGITCLQLGGGGGGAMSSGLPSRGAFGKSRRRIMVAPADRDRAKALLADVADGAEA